MKTTERFERAVSKLYKAFHGNTLNAFDCTACAVGNLCDNDSSWAAMRYFDRGIPKLVSDRELMAFAEESIFDSGYSPKELIEVEKIFLFSFKDWNDLDVAALKKTQTKEEQFIGLCSVVDYLAQLDDIPNPMDYSALFETENDSPKYKLEEVFC